MRFVAALVVASSFFSCGPTRDTPPSSATATSVFQVEGMTCGGCESSVKTALETLDGVEEAEVSHKKSRTSVTYDPVKVSPRELEAAIESAGYRASLRSAAGNG